MRYSISQSIFCPGAYDSARAIIDEVIHNAKTPDEKLNAYTHRIMCLMSETSEYGKGAEMGVEILSNYGIDIPFAPSKAVMAKEEMKYKLALRNRSVLSCLTSFPIKDDPLLALCQQLIICANRKSIHSFWNCTRVLLILTFFSPISFWKAGRHEAIVLEANPICSEEGKFQLEFGAYYRGVCFNVCEGK